TTRTADPSTALRSARDDKARQPLMPDPAEQLQRLYLAGFELQTFERYPNAVGVLRDGCIALLQSTPGGLKIIGAPGWRMGEVLGVLVEKDGRKVFQSKSETV